MLICIEIVYICGEKSFALCGAEKRRLSRTELPYNLLVYLILLLFAGFFFVLLCNNIKFSKHNEQEYTVLANRIIVS